MGLYFFLSPEIISDWLVFSILDFWRSERRENKEKAEGLEGCDVKRRQYVV